MSAKQDWTRVTVNLNSELVKHVDAYGERMGINRTSAVSVLLTQALNEQKAVNDLSELLELVRSGELKVDKF